MFRQLASFFLLAAVPAAVSAQVPISQVAVSDSGDTAWMLAASALVLLMALPGLGLFYGGLVRARNVLSVLAQIGAIVAIVSLLWIVVGYTLAFGAISNGFIGNGVYWMLGNLGNVREGMTVPESAFVLFEMGFALFAAAALAGAWVGRARFGWTVAFAALWSIVVYAPVVHWTWGGGWLVGGAGTIDFAGGLVVHTAAGVSALVTALLLGRRAPGSHAADMPSAPALSLAGGALLWVGWFGFVGASALTATDDAAAAIINAHAAGAAGALTWVLIDRVAVGRVSATGWARGALAGLVTATASAGYIAPFTAMVLGFSGALACRFALGFIRDRLRIDDSLGVFALHGVGGMLGTLLLAVVISPALGGVGYVEGVGMAQQFGAQAIGIAAVVLYSAVASAILALMVSVVFPMRVNSEAEEAGLDASTHGERAYALD